MIPKEQKISGKSLKEYQKPTIIFEKKIETLAAACDSAWLGGGVCMKAFPPCESIGS